VPLEQWQNQLGQNNPNLQFATTDADVFFGPYGGRDALTRESGYRAWGRYGYTAPALP
jgi:hypothetical protein